MMVQRKLVCNLMRGGFDSSVAIELFGPIWDDINLKDGVVESKEACDPVVNNYTSE